MPLPRPQRVIPLAPIGSLLKRITVAAPRGRGLAEPKGGEPGYIQRIQELPCLFCGVEPCGEAAHVRFASAAFGKASGMGKRPEDKWAAPLCRDDHLDAKHAQHQGNEQAFWERLGIPILAVCLALHAQGRDLVAMRMVVVKAISERSKQP